MSVLSLCIIICVLCAVMGFLSNHDIFNPITIFCGLWAIIVSLSSLHLYTLNVATNQTYSWILTGIISFVTGFCLYRAKKVIFKQQDVNIINDSNLNKSKLQINYGVPYALLLICILFIFYNMSNFGISISLIVDGLRSIGDTVSSQDGSSGLINAISFLMINPLFLSLTVFEAIDFWMGARNKKLFFLTVVMTVGRIFITGGRQAIIQFVIVMIVSASFAHNGDKEKSALTKSRLSFAGKIERFFIFLMGIGVFFLLSVSKTSFLLKTIYLDFAMQPVMLQTWVNQLYDQYAYGAASLFGFIHPFLYFGKNLFHLYSDMPVFFGNIYNNIQSTFSTWISIGSSLHANAYTSIFWYLYYDGRVFGIFFGMLLLGLLSGRLYTRAKTNNSPKAVANYLVIALCLIYSFTDMELYKASFVLGWFYLNILLSQTVRSVKWEHQKRQ